MGTKLTPTALHWGNYGVVAEGGRVVALQPAAADPAPSPIGPGMAQALYDPVRILNPAVRKSWLEHGPRHGDNMRGAEPFVEVSWDTALDLIAGELSRVQREHGQSAIFGGSGWASAGKFHDATRQIDRFLATFGGCTSSVNSYSMAALEVILPHVIGGFPFSIFMRMPLWSEIAEHGDLVVAFGGLPLKNGLVNPGGASSHHMPGNLDRCRRAGVEFVSISPQRSDTTEAIGAEWIAARPNTDTAIMLGLAHTLAVEGLADRDYLERCCVGYERFERYLLGDVDGTPKDAAWAATIAGIEPETIVRLARRIAEKRTLVSVNWAVQRSDHGEQPYWAAVALAAMSGSMGRPGGGFGAGQGSSGFIGHSSAGTLVASLPKPKNEVADFIPIARIADMLLNPGSDVAYNGQTLTYPDIRLMYWCGGNPFHHAQDLNRLVRGWQRPETVIVHEPWWNANARFADIVLPVCTPLERNDVAAGMFDRHLSAMHKAADGPGQARTDYEAFAALAQRLGVGEEFTEGRTADEWVRHLYEGTRGAYAAQGFELPLFDEMWDAGGVQLPELPARSFGTFDALRADADEHPIPTPSGRIEIFSETIDSFGYDDCPGHPAWLEPAEWLGSPLAARFPLHLLSNQPSTRLHSQYDNGGCSLESKVAGREPVLINPEDAAARGIADGDLVRIFNDRGACLAGAVISDALRPSVIQLATGAWYDPVEPGVPGSLDRHGNPNTLTLDQGTSSLAQGPSAGTTLVEVERYEGDPLPVQAFQPPVILRSSPGSDDPCVPA